MILELPIYYAQKSSVCTHLYMIKTTTIYTLFVNANFNAISYIFVHRYAKLNLSLTSHFRLLCLTCHFSQHISSYVFYNDVLLDIYNTELPKSQKCFHYSMSVHVYKHFAHNNGSIYVY